MTDVTDLDHVILGINRLDRGIQRFAALTSVTPVRGGQHPGRGTENALVGLGTGRYLEILAAIEPGSAPSSYASTDHEDLTLVGWALQTRSLSDLMANVRAAGFDMADPKAGSRTTPGGQVLRWRAAKVTDGRLANAPFFIEWDESAAHPSLGLPGGCHLRRMGLTHPDPATLEAFFRSAGYHADVSRGDASAMRMVLDCPRGQLTFSSD